MFSVPHYNVSSEQDQIRHFNHLQSAHDLIASINSTRFLGLVGVIASAEFPDSVCLASNPKWANRPFGFVGTVERSACLAFVSKLILDLPKFRKYFGYVTMEHVFTEMETKGYRLWSLQNIRKTFNIADRSLDSIKELFPGDPIISKCTSSEQVYEITGIPVGIGGSVFFLDNIIAMASSKKLAIGKDTRLHNFDEIVTNLNAGVPVPVRVQNSIYRGDDQSVGGHYIILYGMNRGMCYVFDSSEERNSGIRTIAAWRLFEAMIEDEGLACAWNCNI